MFVSIVIPVYNSQVLQELVSRIERVFATRPADRHEIVFVDDASPLSDVWPTIAALATDHPQVTALQLTRNFGQHAATLCGLREARGEVVMTMDDDLQHNPEDIPKFLEHAESDVVIGQFLYKRHDPMTRVTSFIKSFFDRIVIGKPKGVRLSSYRMLSRVVVDGMLSIRTPYPFIPALIFQTSKQVKTVELSHSLRREGTSGYSLVKRLSLFTNLLINNSSLVLRLVGSFGLVLAFISLLSGVLLVHGALFKGDPLMGWASLCTIVLLIGGILLFSFGVVGEYLIRLLHTAEDRASYRVRRSTASSRPGAQEALRRARGDVQPTG
ncbi:MAG: glycosyltransferase family 2 protein [Acidobacteria bacterium]|nr:glycosyltransferase family 2 protein [Acidobacteriota bacterium]